VYGVQEAAIREVAQERNSRRKKKNSSWSSRARDTPFQTTAILSFIFDERVFFASSTARSQGQGQPYAGDNLHPMEHLERTMPPGLPERRCSGGPACSLHQTRHHGIQASQSSY
jgi:hypothetical protein